MSDHTHSPESIASLASRHGIEIDPGSVVFNNIGLDFVVAFATATDGYAWVLRLPRRPDVVVKSKHEGKILALVRKHLPVAVPDWQVHTDELIAYPRLPGTPGLTVEGETYAVTWHFDLKSPTFAQTFGQALAALHGIDHEEARAAGLTVRSPNQVREKYDQDMARVRAEFGVPDPLWNRWQAWLMDKSFWPDFSTVIHGDLYAAHVIIDEQARATGIIDWTEAVVADPATDFQMHLISFGDDGFAQLVAAYVAAGGRVWPRLKDHCQEMFAASSLNYALYALTTNDETHRAEARRLLSV